MNTRGRGTMGHPASQTERTEERSFRLAPIARAIALTIAAGGVVGSVHAAQPFSAGWYAGKGAMQDTARATGMVNGKPASSLTNPAAQQQQANTQLQKSIENLSLAAHGIAMQQAQQAATRQAAMANMPFVPNGLGAGGLDAGSLAASWVNANAPTQTTDANGKTVVDIVQTGDKAIANWETFHVGQNTIVQFEQQSSWAILNRITDPSARPSQIQGQIRGNGTVMIVNRNGIVFAGTSQINTRNLVASAVAMSDAQFKKGIFSDVSTQSNISHYTPSFGNDLSGVGLGAQVSSATGDVIVEADAKIATIAPQSVTEGGGYVLMMGREVHNAGTIMTPVGQTTLAAGDSFIIRKGVGTDGNQNASTRGNEVTIRRNTGSVAGTVVNSGLIVADTGDITLTGHTINQQGVIVATTSVNTRGTVHLLNSASDTSGSITLAPDSVTSVIIADTDLSALDTQRAATIANAPGQNLQNNTGSLTALGQDFDNLGLMTDRRDQSRVEIVTGGTVDFQHDSMTLATGGQVAVAAGQRSLVADGATIDVSGAVGVRLSMASNNLLINIQGNEQRDAATNRDSTLLNNSDVWVDTRTLVYVPAGTGGYATDRWYTAGGLLEVSGYLANAGHTAGEWMAQGGNINFTGKELITQQGSSINLSGGTLDVQSGRINQSWLKGADGRLYEVSKAPGDLLYTGLYKGFESIHARWGDAATSYFYNPLIAPRSRLENGYTVGRDAGKLIIGTHSAVLEGDIIGNTYQGPQQQLARQDGLDGYDQSQKAVARGGQLIVGSYVPYFQKDSGTLQYALGEDPNTIKNVVFGQGQEPVGDTLDLQTALPADRRDTLFLDVDRLAGFALGAIDIAASGKIDVNGNLQVANGGEIVLFGNHVALNADVTAHSGNIQIGNTLARIGLLGMVDAQSNPLDTVGSVTVADGVRVDASGLWSNLRLDPDSIDGLAYVDGGNASIRNAGDVTLGKDSVIDVSSGAAIMSNGKLQGGRGGDLTAQAINTGTLVLDGALQGFGVSGGGTLNLMADKVLISDQPGAGSDAANVGTLVLGGDFFDKGFSAYAVTGQRGLSVADGTQVNVQMPVYHVGVTTQDAVSGTDPAAALVLWTPPLYQDDVAHHAIKQRGGASLSLQAGTSLTLAADLDKVGVDIGEGVLIHVDPGQSIAVSSVGQLTVDGTLQAQGGNIALKTVDLFLQQQDLALGKANNRSIWIGDDAVLDASAAIVTAVDSDGRRYGLVGNGGSIVIGGEINPATGDATAATDFIVVRKGALLDASGAQATLDIPGLGAINVAGNGGSISLSSDNGLFLDGTMVARAGGAGAAGGSLNVALLEPEVRVLTSDPVKFPLADLLVRKQRELMLAATQGDSVLAAGLQAGAGDAALVYGYGRLGTDTVTRGGFDNLSLLSNGSLSFAGDMQLHLGQSLNLYSNSLKLADSAPRDAHVMLDAPYVRLAGVTYASSGVDPQKTSAPVAPSPLAPLSDAGLDVTADLIDIRDTLTVAVFGLTTLHSEGDLRFLQGKVISAGTVGPSTQLSTIGSLTLQAAQVYPGTGVVAAVSAGGTVPGSEQVLRIEGVGAASAPAQPYSVFGDLKLDAATIEQGGVLRAPLGDLRIGSGNANVVLLPGSETSVSGNGLVMPYGGTVDGLSYLFNGKTVTLTGVGGANAGYANTLAIGVTFAGVSVDAQPGAVLDLSGGGTLTGAGFVSGRGGSTDARFNPLVQNSANGSFRLPGLASNPIYAIVPGTQASIAPNGGERGAVDPMIGQQITLGQGVPGLPAGTYTLLPSTYALLPGAFRVELNGAALGPSFASSALRNGSWSAPAQLSVAHTGIADNQFRQAIVTSADVLRKYSQYDETSYADFILADAARVGVPRAMLPADTKSLLLNLNAGAGADAFQFDGTGRFAPAAGGYGGTVTVTSSNKDLEIVAPGAAATAGFTGITMDAGALNALGASRLVIGGLQSVTYGQGGNLVGITTGVSNLTLRSGAILSAPEVFLWTLADTFNPSSGNSLIIEQGAGINTLGRGKAAYDAADGFVYANSGNMVAVSNGVLSMLPVSTALAPQDNRSLQIGVACIAVSCSTPAELYSEGSIVLATPDRFVLDDTVRYGTRNLTLAVQGINVGNSTALADAAAHNVLPAGLSLNQDVLDRLLRGDTQHGAPALETLILSASSAVSFYGTVELNTLDPVTGKSTLGTLVLGTPAIYGDGLAGDVATIRTGNLIWKGAAIAPGMVVAGGAGTGSGTLEIDAERIEFGYGPGTQPTGQSQDARLALGFANVNLNASDRVTANQKGSLSVYQTQGAYDVVSGYQYSGGNLHITAPLVTGEAGSVNSITAGGSLVLTAPAGLNAATAGPANAPLGAELTLAGSDIILDTTLALPSGKLTVSAAGNLTLTDRAFIDMAGRKVDFNDVSKYSWGGDVILESRGGNLRQAAGSVIDLSAQFNHAGSLKALALDDAAGVLDLQGKISGSSSGMFDAGGTLVPYLSGSVEIRAQHLGDSGTLDTQFAALNQRLNDGGVFGERSFQLKQGDLTIGNELKANEVNVSVDNGSLTVIGKIDASGAQVGSIYLAAKNNLTIAGTALLDAHGSTLRVDSYGKIIDSPNRAIVNLTANDGQLTLASGASIDLRHGTDATIGSAPGQNDGLARGTLELTAGRTGETSGDIRIDASGNLTIQGARSIAVNGAWRYTDAAFGTDASVSGRPYQVIDQAYLDAKDAQSTLFMTAALANGNLLNNKLAGLRVYTDAFHLRPGVEIASATPDGDLVVQGDLDLSGYRYASVNPLTQKTGVYGSGEPGALTIRAGGDLNIYGSITDGFAPPPVTQDDTGWLLLPGVNFNGSDTVLPHGGVVIADGTTYQGGATLNYDLPIKAMNFDAGLVIPAPSVLTAPMTVAAGMVFSADVRDAAGVLVHAAGTIVAAAETLPAGTRLGAGMRLPAEASLAAMIWPKGVPLLTPMDGSKQLIQFVLNGDLTLLKGAFLPAATNIKLQAGVDSIDLRPSVNSRQGALWAVATMLPEGSQSWSLRLLSGADTAAADSRIVKAHPAHGDLRLADSHYGMYGKLLPPTGGFIWTQQAEDESGGAVIAGHPVTLADTGEDPNQFCSEVPEYCAPAANYGWSQDAVDELANSGITVTFKGTIDDAFVQGFGYASAADFCSQVPSDCVSLSAAVYANTPAGSRFSVIRTGAADLELMVGGSLRMNSLYGVYTAGTSSMTTGPGDLYNLPRVLGPNGTVLNDVDGGYEKFVNGGVDSLARAWYPTGGGNLTIKVGGDLSGDLMQGRTGGGIGRPNPLDNGSDTADIGNWLWRQGSGSADQPTAWSINFGSYVGTTGFADQVVGFTGFGTLGGGDLRVEVGGNAGKLETHGLFQETFPTNPGSQGLVLAVGGTGRVLADGSLSLTGGGDLDVRIGGTLNPGDLDHSNAKATLNGAIINLRGDVQLQAGAIGNESLKYQEQSRLDPRAVEPFVATDAIVQGGIVLAPGDATFNISTRGELAVEGVNDPGRITTHNLVSFSNGGATGNGQSWFSLWTPHTAVNLFSVGGDVTPVDTGAIATDDSALVYPSILTAVAASGSLYYGVMSVDLRTVPTGLAAVLAPSANGKLEFLAADSIYGNGMTVSQSGAASSAMATPFHPAIFATLADNFTTISNLTGTGNPATNYPLFAFGPDTASAEGSGSGDPARFYAVSGDLVGVSTGRIMQFGALDKGRAGQTWYEGAQQVWMMAGRDIVDSGTPIGEDEKVANTAQLTTSGNLFVHNQANDVSIVSAGRDIVFSNFNVAGPGTLEITAGRNLRMDDRTGVTSIGAVVPGDARPGADIAMLAGVGANGPDYAGFAARYLDPANLAQAGVPLAGQPDKVVKTYDAELVTWLGERYGFKGTEEEARAAFAALPAEQQRIFDRQIYFAELKEGGREFNDAVSPRFGSYLRGRDAIAALFPTTDATGNPVTYSGDLTMFRAVRTITDLINGSVNTIIRSGFVQTQFGGDIDILTPGGRQLYGTEGAAPAANAGLLTRGAGDISMYSLDSILLGQSRIMTTFGGSILGWSAQGDINAGKGSKTTVVFTPPKRVYDDLGNVTLASDVPSTGAGIATLAPIPEVPAGDVDLIAPQGTIDAGEAGIRVSGNVNLAALQVVNAANIKVKGDSTGIPLVAQVNVSALTNAGAAATQAAMAAQNVVQSQRTSARQSLPSIFTVRVLGFGNESAEGAEGAGAAPSSAPAAVQPKSVSYDTSNRVQLIGHGSNFKPEFLAGLSDEERRKLQQDR